MTKKNAKTGFGEVQLHNTKVFQVTQNLNMNGAEIIMKQRYPKVQLGPSIQKEGRPVAIRYRTLLCVALWYIKCKQF